MGQGCHEDVKIGTQHILNMLFRFFLMEYVHFACSGNTGRLVLGGCSGEVVIYGCFGGQNGVFWEIEGFHARLFKSVRGS